MKQKMTEEEMEAENGKTQRKRTREAAMEIRGRRINCTAKSPG